MYNYKAIISRINRRFIDFFKVIKTLKEDKAIGCHYLTVNFRSQTPPNSVFTKLFGSYI